MDANLIDKCISSIQKASKIIVLTGAGISTSAGIPDFRSPETGLYHNLQKYHLPYPEAIFDIDYFIYHPEPFFELIRELRPGHYQPTPAHRFIRLLEEEGKLLRTYTQNIDGLERAAHIEKFIECHGTFQTATCLSCRKKYTLSAIETAIQNQEIPRCPCHPDSIIKPDVVFFGESLPMLFHTSIPLDFPQCDLLLVMGTSLTVYPVAGLIDEVLSTIPIFFLNNTPPPPSFNNRLQVILGHCDQLCMEIAAKAFGRKLTDTDR